MDSYRYHFFIAFINEYNFWLIIAALTICQGFILSMAILFKSKEKIKANVLLSLFVFLIALSLIGRLVYYFIQMDDAFLPAGLVDIMIYCYGPLSYYYLMALLNGRWALSWRDFIHFVPLAINLIYFFYRLCLPKDFGLSIFNTYISSVYFSLEMMAIMQNGIYTFIAYRMVTAYEARQEKKLFFTPKLRYIKIFIALIAFIVLLWFLGFLSKYIEGLHFATIITYNFAWMLISFLTFLFAYLSYFDTDIISIQEKPIKYNQGYLAADYYILLKDELDKVMDEERPYLNPKLALSELATIMGKNPRDISRAINEHYQQNFYEYINTWRINKFKELVLKPENRTFTILSLAYESGFNSKATFNAAFKKITQLTPSEYISLVQKS